MRVKNRNVPLTKAAIIGIILVCSFLALLTGGLLAGIIDIKKESDLFDPDALVAVEAVAYKYKRSVRGKFEWYEIYAKYEDDESGLTYYIGYGSVNTEEEAEAAIGKTRTMYINRQLGKGYAHPNIDSYKTGIVIDSVISAICLTVIFICHRKMIKKRKKKTAIISIMVNTVLVVLMTLYTLYTYTV
jgi:hypothetical protein